MSQILNEQVWSHYLQLASQAIGKPVEEISQLPIEQITSLLNESLLGTLTQRMRGGEQA